MVLADRTVREWWVEVRELGGSGLQWLGWVCGLAGVGRESVDWAGVEVRERSE